MVSNNCIYTTRVLSIIALILIVVVTLPVSASSAGAAGMSNCRLKGIVTDSQTGEPLIGVSVLLRGRHGGTMTDSTGMYQIKNLPSGTYGLQFSHIVSL